MHDYVDDLKLVTLLYQLIRKSKDYVYGIWVYKALGIWKGYYRVKKSLVSYMKPWTEARNNKYMKSLLYQYYQNLKLPVDSRKFQVIMIIIIHCTTGGDGPSTSCHCQGQGHWRHGEPWGTSKWGLAACIQGLFCRKCSRYWSLIYTYVLKLLI